MLLRIVAVRDIGAECFGQPNFVVALGLAVRSFGDEVNRVADGNSLNRHPEDFELYELGSYSDSDASFTLLPQPRLIARAVDLARAAMAGGERVERTSPPANGEARAP